MVPDSFQCAFSPTTGWRPATRGQGRESARGYRAGRFPLRRREEAGHGRVLTGPGSTMRRGCSSCSAKHRGEKACLALEGDSRARLRPLALLARRAGRRGETGRFGTAQATEARSSATSIPPARLPPPRQSRSLSTTCRTPRSATGPRWCWWARPAAGRRRCSCSGCGKCLAASPTSPNRSGSPRPRARSTVAFDGAPEDQEADFLNYRQLLETVECPRAGR